MTIALAGRLVVIAVVAATIAWLPPAVLVTWGMDAELRLTTAVNLLLFAFVSSFLVGLPIAALCSVLRARIFARGFSDVAFAGIFVGVILLVVTFAVGGIFGAVFIGLPAFIAVCVYAALGWLWILRPELGLSSSPVDHPAATGASS